MYKQMIIIFLVFLFTAGCEDTNLQLATEAGIDAFKAVTLSDDDVKLLAVRASRQSDQKQTIAPLNNRYGKRLNRLVGSHIRSDGYTFDFKVYLAPTVNAFAMADGTIRIYSGLMDMMDDGELLFVIGHEMGHVVEKHIKKKIMLAYAGSALRKGIASQGSLAGEIAKSGLGGLFELLLNAQFSQQEEREADDFGIAFLKREEYDIMAAVSALKKLAGLGSNHSFLSSHPEPGKRAERLQNQVDAPETIGGPSAFEKLLKKIVAMVLGLFS